MGVLGTTLGLPVTGPMRGLAWLARQIAEAASREMADPARIESALLALERKLNAGEIDEASFEAEEALLLAQLDEIGQPPAEDEPTQPADAAPKAGDGPA
jgi:hypothetical protein